MTANTWISRAPSDASNLRPLLHSFSDINAAASQFHIKTTERNADGFPLGPECFPDEIWIGKNARPSATNLPHLFYAGAFWVISATAAHVLRQFDLGKGALYPVRVLQKDRVTPLGEGYCCINFGNRKSAFLPDQSENARHGYIRDGRKGWFPRSTLANDQFAVSAIALAGPDIWIDPDVGDAIFVSDAFARALKRAKADKGWFLKTCRMIEV